MLKIWGKVLKRNKIVQSHTAQNNDSNLTDQERIDMCMDEICRKFDIQKPLWLPIHYKDLAGYRRVKFNSDSFMEDIPFDTFEIEIIEEDTNKNKR